MPKITLKRQSERQAVAQPNRQAVAQPTKNTDQTHYKQQQQTQHVVVVDNEILEELCRECGTHPADLQSHVFEGNLKGIAESELVKAMRYLKNTTAGNKPGLLFSGSLFDDEGRCKHTDPMAEEEARLEILYAKQAQEAENMRLVKEFWRQAKQWYDTLSDEKRLPIRQRLNEWVKDTIYFQIRDLCQYPWQIPGAKERLVKIFLESQPATGNVIQLRKAA